MFGIEMQEMSKAFFECWKAAGNHLNRQVDGGIPSWLRAHPYPPFLEHLSFRLGNQLFYVRVVDVDGKIEGPGTLRGLLAAASGTGGHACLLPMKHRLREGWTADLTGWGLKRAETGELINPAALVTSDDIPMTEWEVHDMAVQVVRDFLEQQGFELMSWQGNPGVDPAIWFVGASGKPEWVVVRAGRFPATSVERPDNWAGIAANCSRMSSIGHFAPVVFANADQPFASTTEAAMPLLRGHGAHVRFDGLQ